MKRDNNEGGTLNTSSIISNYNDVSRNLINEECTSERRIYTDQTKTIIFKPNDGLLVPTKAKVERFSITETPKHQNRKFVYLVRSKKNGILNRVYKLRKNISKLSFELDTKGSNRHTFIYSTDLIRMYRDFALYNLNTSMVASIVEDEGNGRSFLIKVSSSHYTNLMIEQTYDGFHMNGIQGITTWLKIFRNKYATIYGLVKNEFNKTGFLLKDYTEIRNKT